MENGVKFKKIAKGVLKTAAGILIGFLLYYNILMEIIPVFISGELLYIIVSIAALLGSIGGSIALIELISSRKIKKPLFIMLCAVYFIAVGCVLFLRPSLERVFVFNPLTGIFDMFRDSQSALQALMNLLLFIPSGYFLKKLKPMSAFTVSILISAIIELIQVISMRGFFDTFDILLYIAGFLIGRFIFKRLKVQIV